MDTREKIGFGCFLIYGFLVCLYCLLKYFRSDDKKKLNLIVSGSMLTFWVVIWILMLIQKTAKFSYLVGMLFILVLFIFSIVLVVRERVPKHWFFAICNLAATILMIISVSGAYAKDTDGDDK
ncbi:hypothetical protein M0812_16378 [Anaeramoeba flamelloides]|uniref:Uncharacterized protein n=1 Tax=Anaeramoeba flamelloides TaxID=1746091 RepID=A0AAV7ZK03_9EUKA|nr:hypothetical protein M0812_16378 [Anaeramoeba flamelloides]